MFQPDIIVVINISYKLHIPIKLALLQLNESRNSKVLFNNRCLSFKHTFVKTFSVQINQLVAAWFI